MAMKRIIFSTTFLLMLTVFALAQTLSKETTPKETKTTKIEITNDPTGILTL
jgi:hypothetical protein